MLLAQLSDLHISTTQPLGGIIDTGAALEVAVAHLVHLNPTPAAVLITGDLVDQGSPAEYQRLRELLAPLTMPVYLMPGNHDDRSELCRTFPDHAYLPAPGEFIQYAVEDLPVRLLVLDTLVPGSPAGALCEQRLDWLAARLAEQPTRPTMVALHHPPFTSCLRGIDSINLQEGAARLKTLLEGAPQVERLLCGHIHRVIHTRWGGTLASVAPSVAHALMLALSQDGKLGYALEPPACQLHVWNPDHGLVTHLSFIGDYPVHPL